MTELEQMENVQRRRHVNLPLQVIKKIRDLLQLQKL